MNGLKLDFFFRVSLLSSSSPENGVNGYYEKSIRAVALHKSRFEIDNTKGGASAVGLLKKKIHFRVNLDIF